ncbi:TolC family protein [Chryseobacterium paridis]|uniref:TolC family protein n=1 Tax=Chryseobacterium paridis TaxID=2800328 RepID=A0ABS1FVC3_9FLAO|nr:TolC family protein [Chryseobacterium paridis]MBK1896393.1 TolC family protein [Chryseobacterium paridis]
MKRYIILLYLAVSAGIKAQIQDNPSVLTLNKIWNISESQNKQLKLAELAKEESDISILEAKDKQLPELSVVGDFRLNSKFLLYENGLFSSPQSVPIKGYGYGLGYNLDFNLYSGGKDKRNIEIKKEEKIRKQYEFELQEDNVKYMIAASYYDLYKFQEFESFISSEISSEKKQLSTIENLNKNGIVLKSDVLRISVKLSQLELSDSDVKKKIDLTKQRLNILMGRSGTEPLDISSEDILETKDLQGSNYEDYLTAALANSPDIKIVSANQTLSELNIKQVKSSLLPKISLYSRYNYTYPQISFYPYSNDLWGFGQIGLKVTYSVDNLYKSKHTIAHAYNLNKQEIEKRRIKQDDLSIKVRDAFLEREQARESVETAELTIRQSTESVRVIRNSYLNQQSLLTDLLDAENILLQAKFNLISAEANLRLSHIKLLIITGTL